MSLRGGCIRGRPAAAARVRHGHRAHAKGVGTVLAGERPSGQLHLPVLGQRAAGRGEDLAELLPSLVAGQVGGLLDGDLVAAPGERQPGEGLRTVDLDRRLAVGGAALSVRVRRGTEQGHESAQEGRPPHLLPQSAIRAI